MRKVLVAIALCAPLLAGCSGFNVPTGFPSSPSRAEVAVYAAMLPPQQARELTIWQDEHSNIWNADVHSKDSCPFLAFMPAFYSHEAGTMSDQKYAEFLHHFYRAKHRKEGHCDCDKLLAEPAAPSPVVEIK